MLRQSFEASAVQLRVLLPRRWGGKASQGSDWFCPQPPPRRVSRALRRDLKTFSKVLRAFLRGFSMFFNAF